MDCARFCIAQPLRPLYFDAMHLFPTSWASTGALCVFFNLSGGGGGMQTKYSLYCNDDDVDEDGVPPATVVLTTIQTNGGGVT